MRSKTPTNSLTTSLLISLDIGCFGGIGSGTGWFPTLTPSCPPPKLEVGLNPVFAVEPEAPWETKGMSYLENDRAQSAGRKEADWKEEPKT